MKINPKALFFFIACMFIIEIAGCSELKISPVKMNFYGSTNSLLCEDVSIYTDEKTLNIEAKWSSKDSKNLADYNLVPESLGITDTFEQDIILSGYENKKQFCFIFSKPGKYYGALVFLDKDKYFGAGIWIKADIKGMMSEDTDNTKIKENNINQTIRINSIQKSKTKTKNPPIMTILLINSFSLLVMLVLLLNADKRKRPEKKYVITLIK